MTTPSVLKFDDPYGADRVLIAPHGLHERRITTQVGVIGGSLADVGTDDAQQDHRQAQAARLREVLEGDGALWSLEDIRSPFSSEGGEFACQRPSTANT